MRGNKLAFGADGKVGYFLGKFSLGTFTRDPQTGTLTGSGRGLYAGRSMGRLALDPVSGNLFLCGVAIASFKTPTASWP